MRLLLAVLVCAIALAARAVLAPTTRLDGSVIVPVVILAAITMIIAARAERA